MKKKEKNNKKAKRIIIIIVLIILLSAIIENNISKNTTKTNNNETKIVNKVTLIDFSAMSKDEIENWCDENNITCYINNEYSDTIEKDGFIKQSKEAGIEVEENEFITITYSLGKEPTIGEKNALKMANSYLKTMAFSRSGLIKQLAYEGFTNEEATYAVDNCGANWMEQAVKMAKSYLNTMAFSRSKLINQLEYEGFTYEQAVYGVEQNGY